MNITSPVSASIPKTPGLPTNISREEQGALKVAVFQRLHPRLYLDRFLAESVRPDGRPLSAFRNVSVNVGSISTSDGSALVRMGDTTVVCGVKAEIAEPELDKPEDGFLVPNVDLPAMCSPKFKPGPPAEEAQVLSDRLNQALVESDFLPLHTLCIHPGKVAWVLYVDATCINYDGNLFDATLLAMVAALMNTRLLQATYNPETQRTTCSRNRPKIPLQFSTECSGIPLGVSFGVYDSTYLLADPTSFEEPLLETSISLVLGSPVPPSLQPPSKAKSKSKGKERATTNQENFEGSEKGEVEIISILQIGSGTLDPPPNTIAGKRRDSVMECLEIAKEQRRVLETILKDSVGMSEG